ncbi:Kif2 motor domain in complex with Adp, partial [Fimicolochytrium jonesii]|uniref:Kif2 motor domain in complex with Adp n=1 Tax=Fimicolochytrium jonesii TaxID=1396493 RepID=UPI0022FDE0BE
MARQSKIRLLQQERSSPALGTTTSVPASSSQSPQKPSAAGPNPKSTTTPVGSPAPVTAAPSPPAATSTPAPAQTTASPSTRASKTVQSIALLAQRRDNRRRQSELARKAQQHEAVANNGDLDSVLYRRKIDAWREKNLAAGGTHIVQPPPPQPAQQDDRTVRIKVCVRKRPLNARETADPAVFDILSTQTALIHLHEPRVRVDLSKDIDTQTFAFDEVFDEAAENEAVYTRTTRGLVEAMFEGGRGTVFAYGQTGSGKTHTVFGSQTSPGLCFYACRDVFHHLSSPASPHTLTLHASFFEIYTGQVYDLLSHKSRITLLEDHTGAIRIQGLTEESPPDLPSLLRLVSLGNEARTTGTTEANPDSSRSHAVLQLRVRDTVTGKVVGKFSMVDLAGSERATDRGVVGKRERVEGAEINKSLLALKECIRALHRSGAGMTTTTTHIPFRASKLTQILRDSFVGKRAQTVMIATVSPGSNSGEHSLNTLRYAWRVKEMK